MTSPLDLSRRGVLTGGALVAGAAAAAQGAVSPPPPPWTGEGFVRRPGSEIHYVTLGDGDGEPVVLLPKLGGRVADWRGVAPLLAARGRKVVVLDLPGHGGSRVMGPPPHIVTVPETAATLKAVLDELGISRCTVVGNSLGGCVGIVMAAFWPHSVSRLGLVSVSLIGAMSRADTDRADAARRSEFDENWTPRPRTAAEIAQIGFLSAAVRREDEETRIATGAWFRSQERGVGVAGIADYLPRIEAPTLLILGSIGRYIKYRDVARERIRNLQVVQIADAGSFVHQERPAETAAAINTFLEA